MSKRPDHRLVVRKKNAKYWTQVGVGWSNDFEGINLKLNPCVTLTDRDDLYVAIRPIKMTEPAPPDEEPPFPTDENVPF